MTKTMFKYFIFAFFASGLFACNKQAAEPEMKVSITTISPSASKVNSSFQDLQGNAVELSDYKGQSVVLNYWATWCAPCIREIPSLSRAADILEDEGFIFLLASDESLEDISDFLVDHEFEGNFLKLNSFFSKAGIEAVPSTVLFNAEGEIVNNWLGEYEWDSSEILAELRKAN